MQDNQPTGSTQQASPPPSLNASSPAEIFELFKFIVMKPKEFFPTMPIEGGMQQPIMFYLIIAGINAAFTTLFGIMNPVLAIGTGIVSLVAIMVGGFVAAAITMAIARMLGGKGNYEATYRAYSYAMAPHVVGFIPLVNLVAALYSLFLLKLAIERSHSMTSQQAVTVVAIQVGLGIIVGLVCVGIAMMLGAAALMNAHH